MSIEFKPDALRACQALRLAFPNLTDGEFIGHLNNIGVPNATELAFQARRLTQQESAPPVAVQVCPDHGSKCGTEAECIENNGVVYNYPVDVPADPMNGRRNPRF